MVVSPEIDFIDVDSLLLDPLNPRLGIASTEPDAPQERILELLRSRNLEELAVSFLENGFWPQEAVIVVEETLYAPPPALVVVEGNRRIAALKLLKRATESHAVTRRWSTLVENTTPPARLFEKVPYIRADSREDVVTYLGFRHVTGIDQWEPLRKAAFISSMLDGSALTYDDVRKKIGMRLDTVQRNYAAYLLLKQIEDLDIEISESGVERRFSVLFLSLREERIRRFLAVEPKEDPVTVRTIVGSADSESLSDFARWLFGTDSQPPLFSDSRSIRGFAKVLSSEEALSYLRSTPNPNFQVALQKAGVEDEDILHQLDEANNQLELALGKVHLYRDSEPIQKAVLRMGLNARELLSRFPGVQSELEER